MAISTKCKLSNLISPIFIFFIFLIGLLTPIAGYRTIGHNVKQFLLNHNELDFLELVKGTISSAENGINEALWGKNVFVDVYGGFQKIQNKKIIEDINPSLDRKSTRLNSSH